MVKVQIFLWKTVISNTAHIILLRTICFWRVTLVTCLEASTKYFLVFPAFLTIIHALIDFCIWDSFPSWDQNLQNVDRRPARYYISLHYIDCTEHSLSKFESHMKYLTGGPLAFEIWKPPGGPLVTSNQKNILFLYIMFCDQRVMMQIVQELCKRPGLNRTGFDMPTIYIPNPSGKVSVAINCFWS